MLLAITLSVCLIIPAAAAVPGLTDRGGQTQGCVCVDGELVSHTVRPSRTDKQLKTRPGLTRP